MANMFIRTDTVKSNPQKKEMNIPSALISRIGSPLQNFIEISDKATFDFSFFGSNINEICLEESDSKQDIAKISTSESLNFSKIIFVQELDNLLAQTKVLNNKLENNLEVLKEREKKQSKLSELVMIHKQRKRSLKVSMREEVYCSCSKQCNIF